MARTYNESKSVFLAGPIEYWWGDDTDPHRFGSYEAARYRQHRDAVRDFFVERHFLVYSPHNAFKGDWNEKMQPVNDYVLGLCDIVVNLKPKHIPGLVAHGTDHEWELARKLDKVLIELPPLGAGHRGTFSRELLEMVLETERLKNGW